MSESNSNKQYKQVPFDIKLAKKIQSGEVEGHLVTQYGNYARLLAFDISSTEGKNRLAVAVAGVPPAYSIGEEYLIICFRDGQCISGDHSQDLSINLLIEPFEETPKHEFKVGNKVRIKPNKIRDSFIRDRYGSVGTITEINNCEITVAIVGSFSIILSPEELELFDSTPKNEFKPFDKVLVRDISGPWSAAYYSHYDKEEDKHSCGGVLFDECIPYDEHLVGTTNNPE